MIILDTNVMSELASERPAPAVLAWARTQDGPAVFTTAICEAELLYGIALMPDGKRKNALERAVGAMLTTVLAGRVLPFDRDAAREYAPIAADRKRRGRPTGLADMQTAAIARARGAAAVATRNVSHFEGCGVPIINPWKA